MSYVIGALIVATVILVSAWVMEALSAWVMGALDERRRKRWFEKHFDTDFQHYMAKADEEWHREHGA